MWPEDLSAEYHLYAVLFCVFVGLVYWNNESSRCLGLAENFLSLLKIICRQFVAPDFFCSAHRACCVKGTGFRILISEKGKQAAFFFSSCRESNNSIVVAFFHLSTAKTKRGRSCCQYLTDSTVWASCEQLFVCQPRNSQSAKYIHIQKINLEDKLTME